MKTRQKSVELRSCKQCGATMSRKRFNGSLEDRGAYSKRVFCDRSCMSAWMTGKIKVPNDRNGRRNAARLVKEACEICARSDSRLHVHHVDKNPLNNEQSNLRTLCGSCHRIAHSPNYEGFPPKKIRCALCENPVYRRGYCFTHLSRIRRHGDPLIVKRANQHTKSAATETQ